ncbi:hypothetical protein HW090_11545 [Pseudomonas sp. ABC1]|uniref:hypothetical protein n=1 Tax=Pseudomonas sp. ABC1 TaxID=2748080 RepID=UPI0015C4080A|nr:hypothetical protein [Pseudomonas sp. ABC1]QLF93795.1 hypothetical protein HW090_11545 [Pseudomonas sp. ABC1]
MFFRLTVVSLLLFLVGCGTKQFDPPIFPLAESKITDFPVSGNVSVKNIQESQEPTIIHSYSGIKLQSDYQKITQTMVEQARLELERHGEIKQGGGEKSISLKVTHLNSNYIAFFWKGTMTYTTLLGNGEQFDITVNHSTGAGVAQDLSGSIADGVVALFKDERVRKYLAE